MESTNPPTSYRSAEGYASLTRSFDASDSAKAAQGLLGMMRQVSLGREGSEPVDYFFREVFGDSARDKVERIRASIEQGIGSDDQQLQPNESASYSNHTLPDLLDLFQVRYKHLTSVMDSRSRHGRASEYFRILETNASNAVCATYKALCGHNSINNQNLLAKSRFYSPAGT
ncbi:hypothetical protein VE03_10719, partial [Pseudogymnoascus sp. 23342-1-I1]